MKALRIDLKNTQFNLKTKERAKKYHMVRFFERKKAVRKLKQATKAFEEVSKTEVKKDIKKAKKVLKHAQVDAAYVFLFPKSEKYIALYPNAPTGEIDENVKKGLKQTDEKRQLYRKKMEEIIDNDRLPFTFEDVLSGKTIEVEIERLPEQKEIDAPQEKEEKKEEDDFFE